MMRTRDICAAIGCVILSGCAATPRVSTTEERVIAHQFITNLETALTVAFAAEKLSEADMQNAVARVAELRQLVLDSETVPMDWSQVLQRIVNTGVQFAIERSTIEGTTGG